MAAGSRSRTYDEELFLKVLDPQTGLSKDDELNN